MTTAEHGVLYLAQGEGYLQQAIVSVRSLRQQMPGIAVTLHTNDVARARRECPPDVDIRQSKEFWTREEKIDVFLDSPFEKTVFLDTDTYVCADLSDLFVLLDRFEMAVAHAPGRDRYGETTCPPCFPEMNSGVVAYRKTPGVCAVLERWRELYGEWMQRDHKPPGDQPPLRQAVYESGIQFCVLPPEYNFRAIVPAFAGEGMQVKIVHSHHSDLEQLAQWLNASREARVFLPGLPFFAPKSFAFLSGSARRLTRILFRLQSIAIKLTGSKTSR
ncbi:MAG: hypothetical protein O2901_08660 [Verrucomicrobia bacterium]|nr:hypothetical protein [Verrucomicrobiota bacterium]